MKKVIVMRGPSGSGKSTLVKQDYPAAVVCSADDHFITATGEYVFVPHEIGLAHQRCLRAFLAAVERDEPLIVVDNTNAAFWEFENYLNIARVAGYQREIINLFPETLAELREMAERGRSPDATWSQCRNYQAVAAFEAS
jgi:predicted kinase